MWPFLYTLVFGLTGAYYAKRLKKNPYIWFAIGCLCKIYTLLFIFLIPAIARLSLYLLKRKIFKTLKKPTFTTNDPTTIDVPAHEELAIDALSAEKLWYYLNGEGESVGPMSFQAFYRDWKKGKISKETYVWNETLTDWAPFKEIFTHQKD